MSSSVSHLFPIRFPSAAGVAEHWDRIDRYRRDQSTYHGRKITWHEAKREIEESLERAQAKVDAYKESFEALKAA
jgi:hypothetical protein